MDPRTDRLDIATRACLIVAVFGGASAFDPRSARPFESPKLAVVWVAVVLAATCRLVRGGRTGRVVLAVPVGAFALSQALATVFSRTPLISAFGLAPRYNGLLTLVLYVVLFVLVADVYRGRVERLRELLYAQAAAATLLAGYIFVQRLGLDPFRWATARGAPARPFFGTMGNADLAGAYLALSLPIAWLIGSRVKGRARFAVVAWSAFIAGAMWLAASRGAFVAVGASVLAYLTLRRRTMRPVVRVAVIAVLLVGASAAIVGVVRPNGAGVLSRDTLIGRTKLWRGAAGNFIEHPVIGTGPQTFVIAFPEHGSTDPSLDANPTIEDEPHDVFLEKASDSGLLGIVSYLVLLVAAGVVILRRERSDVAVCVAAILAAYLAQALFSLDFIPLGITHWTMLGAVAAIGAEPRPFAESRRRLAYAVVAAVALVGVAPVVGDLALAAAADRIGAGASPSDVARDLDVATHVEPFDPSYRVFAGEYFERAALGGEDTPASWATRAVGEYRAAQRVQPGAWQTMLFLGRALVERSVFTRTAFPAEAQRWMARAERAAPFEPRVMLEHARILTIWSEASKARHPSQARVELCRATALLAKVTHRRPHDIAGRTAAAQTRAALGGDSC